MLSDSLLGDDRLLAMFMREALHTLQVSMHGWPAHALQHCRLKHSRWAQLRHVRLYL